MSQPHDSKAQRTAQHILEKAAPVFNRRGYAGTSLSDITQATGLTKGGIYGNFRNKDDLALQAFEHNLGCVRQLVQREVRQETGSLRKLLAYPRAYRMAFSDLAGMGGCPIANTAVDADDTHQGLHHRVLEVIASWREALMLLVRRGQEQGEIKPQADPAQVAETIISLVEGGSIMAKATGRQSFMMHALDQVEALIQGIAA